MAEPANILIVEDHKGSRITLVAVLEEKGHRLDCCETFAAALNHIIQQPPDLVISDLELPDGSGLQILSALKKINPDAPFILITGQANLASALDAVSQGAFAYHIKPLDIDDFTSSVRDALNQ